MLGGSGTTIPRISAILALTCAVIGVLLAVLTSLSWGQASCLAVAVFAACTAITVHYRHIERGLGKVESWIGRHTIFITVASLIIAATGFTGVVLLGPKDEATAQENQPQQEVRTLPSVGGWGPDRPTFTSERPASYAVLNSIVNYPGHGDERNFVQVRPVNNDQSPNVDLLSVRPGDEILVRAFVANDVADNFQGPSATIHGLRARFGTYKLNDSDALTVSIRLSGLNARDVWDSADLQSNQPIKLSVIPGTATMKVGGEDEFAIDDTQLKHSDGALIGASQPDGEFPVGNSPEGKYRGAGYLSFHVKVEAKVG